MTAELDAVQREARNLSTDLFKMKTAYEEHSETVEALRHENKALSNEIRDLTDQLGEGGRSQHEMQKMIRRLEIEKEELQHALDEAEGKEKKDFDEALKIINLSITGKYALNFNINVNNYLIYIKKIFFSSVRSRRK